VLQGNRLALARLLSQIENNTPEGRAALVELYPQTGRAHRIGVTGAPGTGKSSLVNQLALHYRRPPEGEPLKVAVVAVDPSSPFTGGAILGDRVRMRDLAGDPGVFIRSMAARGSLGGLAAATSGVVQALDAAGFDVILVETVGAGQAEVDIARLAHTTLVIDAPGLGDDIQAIKAGILEIADVLVINKADRAGVENTERSLRSMLLLGHPTAHVFRDHSAKPGHGPVRQEPPEPNLPPDVHIWIPPILRTVATEGQGIPELAAAIAGHRQHLAASGELGQRELARLSAELDLLLREALVRRWRERMPKEDYTQMLERVARREISPWQAADELSQGD
jgi:LAO/AO transport system kinase